MPGALRRRFYGVALLGALPLLLGVACSSEQQPPDQLATPALRAGEPPLRKAARADLAAVAPRLQARLLTERVARAQEKLTSLWRLAEMANPE